ncbi:MAG: hypothetical protein QXH92_00470 [Candidatus Aenigmatarchaeota archaeon]
MSQIETVVPKLKNEPAKPSIKKKEIQLKPVRPLIKNFFPAD